DIASIDAGKILHYASLRVRMPRLRAPLRTPDARRPDTGLPVVRERRFTEAVVGVCRRSRRRREDCSACRTVRGVRRPARARFLLDPLAPDLPVRAPA